MPILATVLFSDGPRPGLAMQRRILWKSRITCSPNVRETLIGAGLLVDRYVILPREIELISHSLSVSHQQTRQQE